jgi:hypothetical protein
MSFVFWRRRQANDDSSRIIKGPRGHRRRQAGIRFQPWAERLEDRLAPNASLSLPASGFTGMQGSTVASFPINLNQLQDNQSPNHLGLAAATLAITYPAGVFAFPIGANQASAYVSLGSVPLSDTAAPGGAADWVLTANSPADGQLIITLTANPGDNITTNTPSTGGSLVLVNFPISGSYNPVATTTEPITVVSLSGSVQTSITGNNGTYVLSPAPPYAGAIMVTPVLNISPSSLPADTVGVSYNQTLKASGAAGALTYSTSGTLPPGVSLNSAGVFSGTPSSAGTFNFTVTASTVGPGSFTSLDDPSASPGSTTALGVSGSNVVGYYYDASGGAHGFLYNGSTYTTLDDPSAKATGSTYAWGVLGSTIVGYYSDNSGRIHGFLDNASTYTTLDDPAAGTGNTFATGISGSNIVGYYYSTATGTHGFLYNGSTYTTLDDPGANPGTTTAQGISGTSIVGYFSDAAGSHGFLYNGSTYTTLDDPLANPGSTFATAISGTNVVGYYSDAQGAHGFLYNGSVYSTFDDPSTSPGNTYVYGASGNSVSGLYFDSAGSHGFFYNSSVPGATGSRGYSVTVNPAVSVTTTSLPNGPAATAYSQTIGATGGTGTRTFSSTGTLPAGLTLNSAGVLSGTPTTPGTYTFVIVATDSVGATASQNYTVVITLATASQLTVSAPSAATAGTPFNITVTAQDSAGHTAAGFNGTVTLGSSAGADIAPTSVTLTGGTATVPITLTTAGAQTLTASFTGLSSGTASVSVNFGAFSQYLVTTLVGAPMATAGESFLVAVQAADPFGNAVTSYSGPPTATATVTPASPASNFPVTMSIGSNGQGFTLATLQKVGTYTITVNSGTFSGTAPAVTVTPATAAQLAFTTQPVNTPTGQAVPAVAVQVLDIFGNLVQSDSSDVITMGLASGPGTFAVGSTTTAMVHNGVANFSNLMLVVPGTYMLSAVVPGRYITSSAAFSVVPLQVMPGSFASSPSGFSLQFNTAILVNSTTPVLFGQGFGARAPVPSVTVLQTKDGTGKSITPVPVEGSVILNTKTNTVSFVATDTALKANGGWPILPDGTYVVDLTSTASTDGFQAFNAGGGFLDGLGTGTAGSGDFKATFVVNAVALHDDVLWVPAVAQGPGQNLNAPGMNQVGGGYPLYLTDGNGVSNVQVTLQYNPALLQVTGVTGSGFTLSASSTPGNAVLVYSGPALASTANTPVVVGYITAKVPSGTSATPTPYKAKDLLHLAGASLNGGARAVATSDALHLVSFVGDADGNGSYSSNDAVLITRAALQTDTGFTAYPLVDPVIVSDTDGAGFIPADAPLQTNEAGVGFPTANLASPPIPIGVVFAPIANNVDPHLSLPADLHVAADDTLTVPVNLDDAHPAGSTGLTQAHLALTYDPRLFTVSAADIEAGSLLAQGSGWSIQPTINLVTGQIAITLSSSTPISDSVGGSLVTIRFHQLNSGEPGGVSPRSLESAINLAASVNPTGQQVVITALEDAQGAFTLTPAPTNGFDPRIDGVIELLTPPTAAAASTPTAAVGNITDSGSPSADTTSPATMAAEPAVVPLTLGVSAKESTPGANATPDVDLLDSSSHVLFVVPAANVAGLATAMAFQATSILMPNAQLAVALHFADQLSQPMGRDTSGASAPSALATDKEAIGRVFAGLSSDSGDELELTGGYLMNNNLSWRAESTIRSRCDDHTQPNTTAGQTIRATTTAADYYTVSESDDNTDDAWYDAWEIQ